MHPEEVHTWPWAAQLPATMSPQQLLFYGRHKAIGTAGWGSSAFVLSCCFLLRGALTPEPQELSPRPLQVCGQGSRAALPGSARHCSSAEPPHVVKGDILQLFQPPTGENYLS